MMYIPPLIISQWLQWRNLPDKIHPSGTIHPDVTRQFLHLHQILGEPAYSRLEQESALTEVLAALFIPNLEPIHPHQGNSEKNSAVEIVKDFLTAHFADNISLCQLSDLAHMSAFHLLRIFQKQVGLSPHAFQTQLRIEKAKQLISQQETLTHIGVQVGFYDQSHFIKTFKSLVGVTPSQYPVS
jgi:AraC-like DNA-binding protein